MGKGMGKGMGGLKDKVGQCQDGVWDNLWVYC